MSVGGRVPSAPASVKALRFAPTDQAGSLRSRWDLAGNMVTECTSFPYGEGYSCAGATPPTLYTGKDRDPETGFDYFGARYYSSSMGRFTSPDWSASVAPIPYVELDDPQSLDLYSYVRNNPLSRIDANGHCWPEWLCNVVTEVKNQIFHGEFTTDTAGAKIRQIDREEAKDRQKSLTLEEGKHPEPHEPNQFVTGATDASGLLGIVAPKLTKRLYLGPISAVAGIANDPKDMTNVMTNVLGLVDGFDGPMALTGAFNDFLDYGANNSTGRVSPKAYDNGQLTPQLPVQDGGCEAAGLGPC